MVELIGNQGEDVAQGDWSHAVRFEVASLRADRSIRGPVSVRALPNGALAILFTVATDVVLEPECWEIRDEEPIALVYKSATGVGIRAPAVLSARGDFPRSLPHLNPVCSDRPVSICLAREGLQALYEREGVTGVLARLRTWLLDAKTGSLQFDGWEPIPAASSAGLGILDGARFQDFAKSAGSDRDRAWGVAFVAADGGFARMPHESLIVSDGNFDHAREAMKQRGLFKTGVDAMPPVPVVFVWQQSRTSTAESIFREYRSGAEFQADLKRLGVAQSFDTAVGELIISNWGKTAERPWEVVAVVGVQRPKPIIPDRVGLSQDDEARQLELKAFLLQADKREGILGDTARVREISLMPALNREVLTSVSGAAPKTSPCLIGCGALGSEIGDFLARMGVEGTTFIDRERLLAHNVARHVGDGSDVLWDKAVILSQREGLILGGRVPTSTHIVKDVEELDAAEEAHIAEKAGFLIDATASERVRHVLPRLARRLGKRIARQELFDGGRLGVQAGEGENGNPDLLDLYYALCRLGVVDDAVSAWFHREQEGNATHETIAAGFSCSSPSFRIPKWKVVAHATAFMPALTALCEGRPVSAGLGLNALSDEGHPEGFRWIDVPAFDVRSFGTDGWEVRIGRGPEAEIRRLTEIHAPRETGGYLYGGYDLELKRVTVTIATPEPPGTVGTPRALRLGRAGGTAEEANIRRRCGNRVVVVGSWHSHPGGGVVLSEKDERTAADFRRENQERGLPTLLVVCGQWALGVYVLE